jgi:hypothetical protein
MDTGRQTKRSRTRLVRGLRWLAAALLAVAFPAAHAQSSAVYPPGSIFAAGTVYPSQWVLGGNMVGGYFGNGQGAVYDIAVTNPTGNGPFLTVFLGNGDGTFAPPANYSFAGSGMQDGLSFIFCGPFTGPGKSDLVVTDDYSNLFLIPGNGDGTFGTPVALNQQAYTLQVFPNANGTLNLVTSISTYSSVTKTSSYSVTVLTNNGSGTFTAQNLLTNSTFPVSEVDYLSIAGTPTLLILGANGGAETSTYANGSFGAPAAYNLNLPSGVGEISSVTPFTLNGNTGFAGLGNGNLYVWIGNSDGSFQTPYEEQWSLDSPVQIATADLNGDGIPDLVLLGGGDYTGVQTIIPLYGTSSGQFSPSLVTGPGVYGDELVIGDVNGDGKPDLILQEPDQGITVLLNQGNGVFPAPNTWSAAPHIVNDAQIPDYPVAMATGDLNGDGITDMVVANGLNPLTNNNTNTVTGFLSDPSAGPGVFTPQLELSVGQQPDAVALAPVNGNLSIFVANFLDSDIGFLQGNGDGTFQSQVTFTGGAMASGTHPVAIATGTIDSSGYPGVIVADDGNNITVFTWSASQGTWTEKTSYALAGQSAGFGGGTIGSITLFDMTGDGNLDLIVTMGATTSYNSSGLNITINGGVLIYTGNGDGTFSATPIQVGSSQSNWNPGYAIGGSLTGNSVPDLLVINNPNCPLCTLSGPAPSPTSGIALYTNPTSSSVAETDLTSPLAGISYASLYTEVTVPPAAAIGDVNGDGINDIVVSAFGLVGVLPGQGAGKFGAPVVQVATTNTAALAVGSFFATGNHDVAVAGSEGVTPLQSLLGKASSGGSAYAEFNPVSVGFELVTPGSPISLPLVLTNAGTTALDVSSYTLQQSNGSAAPEFTVTGVQCGSAENPTSIVIPPNENCTFTVQFSPVSSGQFNAEIVFADNAQQSNVTSTGITGGSASYQQIIPLTGFGASAPIEISPTTLPGASINTAYSQTFTATGGTGGYTFSLSAGKLPAGLTLSGATLSGTPTAAGTFPITITATDSSGDTGSQSYNLTVGCPTLSMTPPAGDLGAATIGFFYNAFFGISGSNQPFSWTLNGNLPQGISYTPVTSTTTTFSGTVAAPIGIFSFDMFAQNAAGCVVTNNYLIEVYNPLTVTANLPGGTVGQTYSGTFTASGGTPAYTYSTISAPPGLTLNTKTGALTGVPTQAGAFSVLVVATDSLGVEGDVTVSLTIVSPPPPPSASIQDNEIIAVSDGPPTVVVNAISDGNEVTTVTDTVTIRYVPVIAWTAPASIAYGTPLGSPQLDAAASIPGTFSYSPAAGAVLQVGTSQPLTVTFTPTDSTVYAPATLTTSITVYPVPLTVTANNAATIYGAPLPAFSALIAGAVNGDTFTESFATNATPLSPPGGSYYIQPSVAGADLSDYDVNIVNGTLTIAKAPTSTALSASSAAAEAGYAVTLTSTVTSSTIGTPTQMVTFYDGSTSLGTAPVNGSGVAQLQTSALNAGANPITAVYSGDSDFLSSTSPTLSELVASYNLHISSSSSSQTALFPGQSATYTLVVTPVYGAYNQPITFTVSGLPAGATASFSSTTVTPGSQTTQVTLTIVDAPLASALNPGPRARTAAILLSLVLPILGLGSRQRRVRRLFARLALAVLFAGAAAELSGCGASGFFNQPPQTSTVTITGASGSEQQSVTLTLTVE